MAKNISTGVDKIIDQMNKKQNELHQLQWRDIRNKIDSILLSTNILKTDEARKACINIDNMSHEQRQQFISERWGPAYLNKISHLLHQLAILENHLSNEASAETNEEYEMKQIEKTTRELSNSTLYTIQTLIGAKATINDKTISAKLIHQPIIGTVLVEIFENRNNQIPCLQVKFLENEIEIKQSTNTLTVDKKNTKIDYEKRIVKVTLLANSLTSSAVATVQYEYNTMQLDELQEDDLDA